MDIDGDLCPLLFLAMAMIPLGRFAVAGDPALESAGLRLAGIIGVVRGGVDLFSTSASPNLLSTGVLSMLAGLLALGPAWIVLSGLAAISGRLCTMKRSWDRRRDLGHQQRLAAEEERHRQERDRLAAAEWERGRPEREAEAARQAAQRLLDLDHQRRRDDARALCELVYDQLAPRIGHAYPRDKLTGYLRTYMGDARPADEVEKRATELQQMLRNLLEFVEPDIATPSIEDLARWYREQKRQIESQTIHQDMLDVQLAVLNERYADFVDSYLTQSRPEPSRKTVPFPEIRK